mgnify:FL=1
MFDRGAAWETAVLQAVMASKEPATDVQTVNLLTVGYHTPLSQGAEERPYFVVV